MDGRVAAASQAPEPAPTPASARSTQLASQRPSQTSQPAAGRTRCISSRVCRVRCALLQTTTSGIHPAARSCSATCRASAAPSCVIGRSWSRTPRPAGSESACRIRQRRLPGRRRRDGDGVSSTAATPLSTTAGGGGGGSDRGTLAACSAQGCCCTLNSAGSACQGHCKRLQAGAGTQCRLCSPAALLSPPPALSHLTGRAACALQASRRARRAATRPARGSGTRSAARELLLESIVAEWGACEGSGDRASSTGALQATVGQGGAVATAGRAATGFGSAVGLA